MAATTTLLTSDLSVWIVYPEDQSVMIHTATSVRELKNDDPITDPVLPEFSCPVSSLFDLL